MKPKEEESKYFEIGKMNRRSSTKNSGECAEGGGADPAGSGYASWPTSSSAASSAGPHHNQYHRQHPQQQRRSRDTAAMLRANQTPTEEDLFNNASEYTTEGVIGSGEFFCRVFCAIFLPREVMGCEREKLGI